MDISENEQQIKFTVENVNFKNLGNGMTAYKMNSLVYERCLKGAKNEYEVCAE